MWNSVDLYSMYSEGDGFKYSRTLIKGLVDHFAGQVVLLSSPGSASILIFKTYCYFLLQIADDGNDKNLRIVAAAAKAEKLATIRNQ